MSNRKQEKTYRKGKGEKMRKKKIAAWFVTAAMAGVLTACGGSSAGNDSQQTGGSQSAASGTVTIKLCHTDPSGSAIIEAIQKFASNVTEASGGRLKIEEYADGIMGDDDEIIEQIYNGANMMNYIDPAMLEPYYPNYSILFSPYFFESYEEIGAFAETEFSKKMQQECKEAGIMALDGMSSYFGSRQIMSNKPISTPADLKGLNFRMPNQATQLELASAWGANPVTVSFSETYSALQQGVVDCVENPIGSLYANSIQEVCDYVNITSHFYGVNGLVMSSKVFDSLDADLQELLLDEAKKFAQYSTEMTVAEEEELLKKMEEEGTIVNRDVDVEAMKEAAQKVFEVHGWPQELLDGASVALEEIRSN